MNTDLHQWQKSQSGSSLQKRSGLWASWYSAAIFQSNPFGLFFRTSRFQAAGCWSWLWHLYTHRRECGFTITVTAICLCRAYLHFHTASLIPSNASLPAGWAPSSISLTPAPRLGIQQAEEHKSRTAYSQNTLIETHLVNSCCSGHRWS